MIEYEHGDWYCKPANEAEAREIVARAIISGAYQGDELGKFRWDFRDSWGVKGAYIKTADALSLMFEKSKKYTITELRQKFPLPGERVESAEWDGEGLPPVGVECEMKSGDDWIKAMLIGFDGDSPVFKLHEIVNERSTTIKYMPCYFCTFRPIRTGRDKFVEAAAKIMLDADTVGNVSAYEAAKVIYDAIKSGALKMPEAEQ